ncbi:MAG: hypothetical protein BGP01_11650 [Paludibacter sp. 47-17]|nr:MAG: hypothetical protein BGP01_11650 [Paludibacter sp. 47-17]
MKPFSASKPEQRLLIATIAATGPLLANKDCYTDHKVALMNAIKEIRDWKNASAYLIKKGIAPVLWYFLSNDAEVKVIIPERDRMLYKQTYLKTLTRSMLLYNAFTEVTSELNRRNLKVVALKGIYLAEALYPKLGIRQFSDIDLLIREDDVSEVVESIKGLGYLQTASLYSRQVSEKLEHAHLPAMIKNGVSIELHIKLHAALYEYKLDTEEFMNRAIKTLISGSEVGVLDCIDMLIHLCVHLDKHFNGSELQFYSWLDIVVLQWKNDINWEELLARCVKYGAKKNVIKQLVLINHIFKTPMLPFNYENSIISRQTLRQLQLHLNDNAPNITSIHAHRTYIKSIPGIKSKLVFIGEILIPSKKLMLAEYNIHNPRLYWLWYPYRWWKFVTSAVRSITFKA